MGLSFGGTRNNCYSCEPTCCEESCYERAYCNVLQWVSTPAVYVPVVLAIPEVNKPCPLPTSTPIIPADGFNAFRVGCGFASPLVVPLAPFFSSSEPLTFSFTASPPLQGGNSITLDPNTGVLTLTYGEVMSQDVTVTITATSRCGSTSQSILVQFCPASDNRRTR